MPETSLALLSITLLPLVRYPNPEPVPLSVQTALLDWLQHISYGSSDGDYGGLQRECVSSCSRTSVRCGQHSHGEIALLRNTVAG